jgi:hypothetical protein
MRPAAVRKFIVPSEKKSARPSRPKPNSAAARDVARGELIARKLAKVAPDEDPAHVAGAIAIFATETIKRSANNLMEARAYLDGLRAGIDGLLKNAFPESAQEKPPE